MARSSIIETVTKTVGSQLRTARLEAHVTVLGAATHVSVTPQTVHNWEKGLFVPPNEALKGLVVL